MGNWPRFVCFSRACCHEQKSFVSGIFKTPWSAVMDVSCVRILHLNLEVFLLPFFPVDLLWPPVRHKNQQRNSFRLIFLNIQIKRGIFVADRPYKGINSNNRKLLVDAKRVDSDPFPAHEKNERKAAKRRLWRRFCLVSKNDKTPISPPKKKPQEDDHFGFPSAYYGALKFLWLFSFSEKEERNWKRRAASGLLLFSETKKAIWRRRRRFNLWLSRPFPSLLLPNTQLNGHPPPYAQYLLPLKRKRK